MNQNDGFTFPPGEYPWELEDVENEESEEELEEVGVEE